MTIFISANISAYTCTTFKLEGGDELAIQEYPQLVKIVFSLIADISLKVTLSISFDWVTFSSSSTPAFSQVPTLLPVMRLELERGST